LPWTANTCALTIGGVAANVTYCGGAPGEVIYQLNFVYPSGVTVNGGTTTGTLAINGNIASFTLVVGPSE
jgi:uncharacterized protein (TIGR03437 family)